jgi:hypothetical protein
MEFSPGLIFTANEIITEQGSHVVTSSSELRIPGIFSITATGKYFDRWGIKNESTGTLGLPGSVTIKSNGGNI